MRNTTNLANIHVPFKVMLLPWLSSCSVAVELILLMVVCLFSLIIVDIMSFYLMYSSCSWINEMFFKFASRILHHKLHAFFPQTFRHSVSNPKPNESFRRYSSTVNCSAFWATVVLSSSFRTKTCTALYEWKFLLGWSITHIIEKVVRDEYDRIKNIIGCEVNILWNL